jgi:hypothetical protein
MHEKNNLNVKTRNLSTKNNKIQLSEPFLERPYFEESMVTSDPLMNEEEEYYWDKQEVDDTEHMETVLFDINLYLEENKKNLTLEDQTTSIESYNGPSTQLSVVIRSLNVYRFEYDNVENNIATMNLEEFRRTDICFGDDPMNRHEFKNSYFEGFVYYSNVRTAKILWNMSSKEIFEEILFINEFDKLVEKQIVGRTENELKQFRLNRQEVIVTYQILNTIDEVPTATVTHSTIVPLPQTTPPPTVSKEFRREILVEDVVAETLIDLMDEIVNDDNEILSNQGNVFDLKIKLLLSCLN